MQSLFDFDTPVDRRGTSSTKWNRYGGRDVIPLWVADMDFRCAPAIVQALRARVDQGIFGYTEPPAELAATLAQALQRDHGWHIEADWIIWLPSLVVGLNVVSRAFAEEGDDILTSVPIYPPFLSAPQNGNRNAVRVPLVLESQARSGEVAGAALGVGHAGAGARGRAAHPPAAAVQPPQPDRPCVDAGRAGSSSRSSRCATTSSCARTRSTAAWCWTPTSSTFRWRA